MQACCRYQPRFKVNLNHFARFVFLARAIDETDSTAMWQGYFICLMRICLRGFETHCVQNNNTMVTYELSVTVHRVLLLPQKVAGDRMAVRVNAVVEALDGQGRPVQRRQETEPGSWHSGSRSRDVMWGRRRPRPREQEGQESSNAPLRPPIGVLTWRLSESDLKHIKAYHPKIKVYCYASRGSGIGEGNAAVPTVADSEPLGVVHLDIRDLLSETLTDAALPLRGIKGEVTPTRLVLSARLACRTEHVPRALSQRIVGAEPAETAVPVAVLPAALESQHLDALPIGEGRTKFDVEVTLEGCGSLSCLAPELEGMGRSFWFSYEAFGMVLQTERFTSLAAPRFAVTTDTFRLAGSLRELGACLASPLSVFLCSDDLVLASAHLPFPALGARSPGGGVRAAHTNDAVLEPQRLGVAFHATFLRATLLVRSDGPVDMSVDRGSPDTADMVAELSGFQEPGTPNDGRSPAALTAPDHAVREPRGAAEDGNPEAASRDPAAPDPPSSMTLSAGAADAASAVDGTGEGLEGRAGAGLGFGEVIDTGEGGSSESPHWAEEEQAPPPPPPAVPAGVTDKVELRPAATDLPSHSLPHSLPRVPPFPEPIRVGTEHVRGAPQPQPERMRESGAADAAKVERRAAELAEAMAGAMAETKFRRMQHEWKRDWEEWQRREEAEFGKRLRRKEATRALELEESFSAREKDRAAAVSRSQAEYVRLEGKLRASLAEVETRERRLASAEEALKQAHAQKLSELQLLQRRLREESRHTVEMERQRRVEVEERLARSEAATDRSRQRFEELEGDFERFRRANRKVPEASLRADLSAAVGAKAEAEGRVERERALKNQALLEKEQYRAQVHLLARALRREQEKQEAMARAETEQLRVEYLAREEKFVLDGDRQQLQGIKEELDRLRREADTSPSSKPASAELKQSDERSPGASARAPIEVADEMERLTKERQVLLATGQYQEGDPVIGQLDQKIRDIARRLYGE